MGEQGHSASVLDTGALIALERGDRRIRQLLSQAGFEGHAILIPAAVLAQVWRNGARQARLAQLLSDDATTVEVLDEELAMAAGVLCGRSGTADVVDASVVMTARRHRAVVVTSDTAGLLALDPHLAMEAI